MIQCNLTVQPDINITIIEIPQSINMSFHRPEKPQSGNCSSKEFGYLIRNDNMSNASRSGPDVSRLWEAQQHGGIFHTAAIKTTPGFQSFRPNVWKSHAAARLGPEAEDGDTVLVEGVKDSSWVNRGHLHPLTVTDGQMDSLVMAETDVYMRSAAAVTNSYWTHMIQLVKVYSSNRFSVGFTFRVTLQNMQRCGTEKCMNAY